MPRDERRQGNGDGKLVKVGGLWKPKPDSKSKGNGSITIKGWKQRFVVLTNTRKTPGSNEPDWILMSSNEPEPDNYQARGGGQREARREDSSEREPAHAGERRPW